MNRSFPDTLAALRRQRNLNQRSAAAELGISQALLSHYENGAREPGLGFVCRACDYYGVTADYLLCRTDKKDELTSTCETAREFLERMKLIVRDAEMELERVGDGQKDGGDR